MLKLPEPGPELPYVQAMWRYARGVALATTGAGREARAELDALAEIARTADFTGLSAAGIPAPDIVRIAQAVLTARIAQAEGEYGKAAASLEKAAVLQDRLPYMEPPYWYYPVHRSLGAARFLSGDLAAAERELQASLRAAPNDAWALWGLSEVYRKQGKADAAAEVERRLAKTRADKGVTIAMEKL